MLKHMRDVLMIGLLVGVLVLPGAAQGQGQGQEDQSFRSLIVFQDLDVLGWAGVAEALDVGGDLSLSWGTLRFLWGGQWALSPQAEGLGDHFCILTDGLCKLLLTQGGELHTPGGLSITGLGRLVIDSQGRWVGPPVERARQAERATYAERAATADRAGSADRAEWAAQADSANFADEARRAESAATADSARQADSARTADRARTADSAQRAEQADYAERAGTADRVERASRADRADVADRADFAERAGDAERLEGLSVSALISRLDGQFVNAEGDEMSGDLSAPTLLADNFVGGAYQLGRDWLWALARDGTCFARGEECTLGITNEGLVGANSFVADSFGAGSYQLPGDWSLARVRGENASCIAQGDTCDFEVYSNGTARASSFQLVNDWLWSEISNSSGDTCIGWGGLCKLSIYRDGNIGAGAYWILAKSGWRLAGISGYNGVCLGYQGECQFEVYSDGTIRASTKQFVADHPTDSTKSIVYVSLEGPENGLYIRGTAELSDGEAVIELPEHFSLIASEQGLTVQLTPIGEWLQLYVVEKSPQRIVVREAQGKSGRFDYLMMGLRKGYEDHQVIQPKKNLGSLGQVPESRSRGKPMLQPQDVERKLMQPQTPDLKSLTIEPFLGRPLIENEKELPTLEELLRMLEEGLLIPAKGQPEDEK